MAPALKLTGHGGLGGLTMTGFLGRTIQRIILPLFKLAQKQLGLRAPPQATLVYSSGFLEQYNDR